MARFVTVALDGLVNLAPGDMAAAKGPLPAWPRAYDSELSALPAGRQIFWGIPLALAPEGGPRWVELACGPVTIPLEGRASYLVVAHFCNASQVGCVGDGGLGYVTRPGEHLADYVLVYSDGNEHRQAIRRRFEIRPGQRELVLPLERPFDLRARGWVTADTHVHFLSPQTAWLEAQAEGLNLLASQWGDLFTNVGDLTGALSGVSTGDTLVWVGTENRQHIMGHISLLGVRGEPVFPLTTAGPEESYIGDPIEASLAEWADRCRAREGLAILPHFPNPHLEAAADIILGKIDGVEIRYFSPGLDHYHLREWYRVLNLGYRMAAVGGTDKMSAGMPVGGVRTYAHLGDEEFSFQSWARAVRAGRTFTTSGPLIGLAVEGHAPGDEVRLPAGGGTLGVEAWADSLQPIHTLELVVNGRVVERAVDGGGTDRLALRTQLHLPGSAWVAARSVSRHILWHEWPIHVAAHTSPVYVSCDGQELFNAADAAFMLTLLDGGLTYLDTLSIPASPEKREEIKNVFRRAQAELHRRMHAHGAEH